MWRSHNFLSFHHRHSKSNGTAEFIEKAILKLVSDKAFQISRLYAFGSDGAAVMTGKRSGVAVQLQTRMA